MRIISKYPAHGVIFAGEYYPVRTGHRIWLEFAQLIEKGEAAAALRALKLCYRDGIPDDYGAALELLCEFFIGGRELKGKSNGKTLFSFTEDEELIYASFYSEYGIDLAKEELHWWRFLALLRGLGEGCALMRAAAIRAVNPSDIKNSAQRKRIIEQKRALALKGDAEADAADALGAIF